ncbi:DUF6134 family protein [Pseudomonadota bacterium]
MNKFTMQIISATALTLGISCLQPVQADSVDAAFAEDEQQQLWRFKVSLDKREIGYHDFLVTRQGTRRMVEISADFDVKILFINAYSYDHDNREIWQDGCLQQIESETDDNGDLLKVVGETVTEGFTLVTNTGAQQTIDSPCVRSFAYWNPAFLESSQLLNSQTGEIVDVNITGQGEDTLLIDDQPVPSIRYEIEMAAGPITLWYTRDSGQWLGLQAATEGGRTLRYEPVQLPFSTSGERVRLAKR